MKTYKDLKILFEGIWDEKNKIPSRSQIQEMRDRKLISSPRNLSERSAAEISFRDLIGIYFSLAFARHGFSIDDTKVMMKEFSKELEKTLGTKNIDPNHIINEEVNLRGLRCFIQDRKYICFVHERPNMEIFLRSESEGGKSKFVWNLIGIPIGEIMHLLANRWLK